MPDLHRTDDALVARDVANTFTHTRNYRARSLAWNVVGCLAGFVLTLLFAPAFRH